MFLLQIYPQDAKFLYVTGNTTGDVEDGSPFAKIDLVAQRRQSMPPMYLYELTHERLWNACRLGWSAADVITFLREYAVSPLPTSMQSHICQAMERWGDLVLQEVNGRLELRGSAKVLSQIRQHPEVARLLVHARQQSAIVRADTRVALKMALAKAGYPLVDDQVSQVKPQPLDVSLTPTLQLRPYQAAAVEQFVAHKGGAGVVVLPCGAGKTVVGVASLAKLRCSGLVLVPNEASASQWLQHFLNWTNLDESQVGLDEGRQALKPVTITTYQRLMAKRRSGDYAHFHRYASIHWGLVIYDEVHLLPAPLTRLAAELTSARRLGLSATLIREDGRTNDVFSLIGPKVYEAHEDQLTALGFLSDVKCVEVQVPLSDEVRQSYDAAPLRQKYRIAADNPDKMQVIEALCQQHASAQILIMGQYTEFLQQVSDRLGCPMLDGETPKERRLHEYDRFRRGQTRILVLSRIANVAVDLPNADVAIQVSGLFGSRQEEAQRLGRVLRPKPGGKNFYSLVSTSTLEERRARHRQQYLVERGFAYTQVSAADILSEGTTVHEVKRVPESRVGRHVKEYRPVSGD
ncbi:DEAD/DEAH box helicase family protein [Alicyclobacillus suci]|uniref:DEAD/DEAH box helicase family protein n=1 Tax=Alicyclobacillus suci TaxID=2816080 RepID=UPI0011BE3FB2|nr:DEAD/DEAH box helicase family protein [Alicyclobacillus suci]